MELSDAQRVVLFGIPLDAVTMDGAVARIRRWLDGPQETCRYIVTPNLDHVVRLQADPEFRSAYASASLVIADGWPVVVASRWLGRPVPERVPGSELVPRLLQAAGQGGCRVYLLGAMPGVGSRAAENIRRRWPGVSVVGTYSPPLGFEHDPAEQSRILDRIALATPDLLVVGFGAPKQEKWLQRSAPRLRCKVAIAAGATIDFLAGEQRRAPRWCQRIGMEWLYRMLGNPKRLARRYLYDAFKFPKIFWNEWKSLRDGVR